MTRFKVDFDGVMDRLQELEQENHHLLDEVKRLSGWRDIAAEHLSNQIALEAENAVLRGENTALRQIVRVVAEADNSDAGTCYQLCNVRWYGGETDAEELEMRHDAPCVVEQARKLLTSESEVDQS